MLITKKSSTFALDFHFQAKTMRLKQKYRFNTLIMTILTLAIFSSCVTTKKVNYLQSRDDLPEYNDSVKFEDYQLQRGDYVYVRLTAIDLDMMNMFNGTYGTSSYQLSGNYLTSDNSNSRLYMYVVGEDDCINYPYVGKLKVVDKTLREVKLMLEDALKDMISGYSVEVRLANRSFSVIGEVGNGKYTIPKEKLTIFEALAMCGDLKNYSQRSQIQIIRQTSKGTVVRTFDIRSRSIVDSEFYYIQPNDVIYVPFTDAKAWGADHVTSVLSITFTTVSLGLLIYSIVDSIVKATK